MIGLLRQSLLHIWRSKLLAMLLFFTFLTQFGVVRAFKNITFQYQGAVTVIGPRQGLFVAMFLQVFTGSFLSAVYGLWLMPYLHSGPRAALSFTLPINKWFHVANYVMVIVSLLAIQYGVLLLCWGFHFGFGSLASGDFAWHGLMLSFVAETFFFIFLSFAFALGSMSLGHVPTFIVAGLLMTFLQVVAVLIRMNPPEFLAGARETLQAWQNWYRFFPPVGEIGFDLKSAITRGEFDVNRLWQWAVWMGLVVFGFRWKLSSVSLKPSLEA